MADIDLQELFQQKEQEFVTDGSGNTRFERDFVSAVNWTTSKISRQADLETKIDKITGPTGDVGLSDEYIDVLSDGVTLRLVQFGHRVRNADLDIRHIREGLDEAIDMIRQDILNQAITADTDNESDFAALGAGTGGVDTGGTNA